jgi:hypothetical protein
MIKRVEVKTYQETLICDECPGEIEMLATVMCLYSHPPQYPHVCPKCRTAVNVRGHTYPRTVIEEKTEVEDN